MRPALSVCSNSLLTICLPVASLCLSMVSLMIFLSYQSPPKEVPNFLQHEIPLISAPCHTSLSWPLSPPTTNYHSKQYQTLYCSPDFDTCFSSWKAICPSVFIGVNYFRLCAIFTVYIYFYYCFNHNVF